MPVPAPGKGVGGRPDGETSRGSYDGESEVCSRGCHSLVVGAETRQVIPELGRRREMNCIQRPELQGQQGAGDAKNAIVDPDHVESLQDLDASGDGVLPKWE